VARLHEYEGKKLLAQRGLTIPKGSVAGSAEMAAGAAEEIDGPVVLKIQAWTTGRAAIGGVAFADTPDQARDHARRLLDMRVGAFPVDMVIVEEKVSIKDEIFVSQTIDDGERAPVMLVAFGGGTGIEDRADSVHRLPVDCETGIDKSDLDAILASSPIEEPMRDGVSEAIQQIATTAREVEARSMEVNPLVTTTDGRVLAADCRVTIDDYAVFRHDELGIRIARELDHPPTRLEEIAYDLEQRDHRGTFYFAVLPRTGEAGEKVIGFHGAGGGGSMMSMDAVSQAGFTPANFTDTSGNPSAAKVYAAARIILSQPGLVGYFGSGSGVASQEQYWSAYGLAKAFNELHLSIPALIRLGGNSEDRAVEILEDACKDLPAKVEGYKKDDPPRAIGERFAKIVDEAAGSVWQPSDRLVPSYVDGDGAKLCDVTFGADWAGSVWIDQTKLDEAEIQTVLKLAGDLLKVEDERLTLAIDDEDAKKRDSDWIALEVECIRAGVPAVFVDIPIEGLSEELSKTEEAH